MLAYDRLNVCTVSASSTTRLVGSEPAQQASPSPNLFGHVFDRSVFGFVGRFCAFTVLPHASLFPANIEQTVEIRHSAYRTLLPQRAAQYIPVPFVSPFHGPYQGYSISNFGSSVGIISP